MQGLAGYNDNSPPSSPPFKAVAVPRRPGPSKTSNDRRIVISPPPSSISRSPTLGDKGKGKANATENAVMEPGRRQSSPKPVSPTLIQPVNEAGPSRIASPPATEDHPPPEDSIASDPFDGMSEEEIFRLVTRPDDIEGVKDWGIPPAVDPEQASDALKAKVEHFLRLKYERGQHINTTLLSSSSFANPHIYSKLVEFVDIDETAAAFPSGGWMTRRDIETLIPEYGPKALAAVQKAKQEAVKRSQESGKRSNIQFAPSRRRGGDDRGSQPGSAKKRYRDEDYRDKTRDKERDGRRRDGRPYDGDNRDRERDRRERR